MNEELGQFLQSFAEAGSPAETGLSFRIRSHNAREKLRKFALTHPDEYVLLALAGLYKLGARHFQVQCDADDFIVRVEKGFPTAGFENYREKRGSVRSELAYRCTCWPIATRPT